MTPGKVGLAGGAILAALSAMPSLAQAPASKPVPLRGTIATVDGRKVTAKSNTGAALTLELADKATVVAVTKATLSDIKDGSFIGSGAMPQPDGTQKAIEIHIFPESMRGTGEGFRPWTHPGSTMTNGTVGATVTAVSGPLITIKYQGGEQKIDVPPGTPIVQYHIGDLGMLKPGAAFAVLAAVKKPDGTFGVNRINVGVNGTALP